MAIFFDFQDAHRRHLGLSKFQFFNVRTAQGAWTALSCQIWSKSFEVLSRYVDFSIFSRWRLLPSWILFFFNFNSHNAHEGQTASPCQIWSKLVEPLLRYGDFSIFPRWRPSAILDLWYVCSEHPQRTFGGFITVQNLVGIDAVVSIICKF